jgi:uncharacterized protein with HEPN domain
MKANPVARDVGLYVHDIWDSISAIEEYTRGLTEEEFCSNRLVQDAVIRRIEIIGEAVKNIDGSFRVKHPDIPWKEMARMRDKIAHEYFGVDFKRVWEVVRQDLPGLKLKFKSML